MIKAKTAPGISKKPIPAHAGAHFTASAGCESTLGNWTVLALIKGDKYTFTPRNGPIFRAKTDLQSQCTISQRQFRYGTAVKYSI